MKPAESHDGQLSAPRGGETGRANGLARTLMLLAAGALITVAVLAFVAYQRPELLLDLTNVRYCG